MRIKEILRQFPGGTNVPDGTSVTFKDSGGSTIDTETTTSGVVQLLSGANNYNLNAWGQVDWETSYGGITRKGSSLVLPQVGPLSLGELPIALQALGRGVVTGYGSALSASAIGTRQLVVSSGAAVVDGIPCVVYASFTTSAASANSSGVTRNDCLCLRVTRVGQTNEGKSEMVIVEGSSTAPADSSQYAYLRLASMTLAHGGTTYTVTDQRTYLLSSPISRQATLSTAVNGLASTTTSSSTSGVSIASGSVTLASGVVYDLIARASCVAKTTLSTVKVAIDINGTTGSWTGHSETSYCSIGTSFALTGVTGTGASVSATLKGRVGSALATGTWADATLHLMAIPRQ